MSDLCFICEDVTLDEESFKFKCDGLCDKHMHAKCVGLNKTTCRAYRQLENLHFLCNDCCNDSQKSINAKLDKLMSLIQLCDERAVRNESNLKEIVMNINVLKESLNNKNVDYYETNKHSKTSLDSSSGKLYADQVKTTNNNNNNDKVIILKPKKTQSCETTKSDLKKSINPNEVNINEIRKGPGGGIAMVCEDSNELHNLERLMCEKLGDNYTIKSPMASKLHLKITGIDNDLSESEILESLKNQNAVLKDKEISIVRLYKVKNRQSITTIVALDTESFNKCLNDGYVKIGWSHCRVFEDPVVYKCYKCHGFNHRASKCKNERSCVKCSGNHDVKECNSNEISCVNCLSLNKKLNLKLNVSHIASSFKCPVYIKKVKSAKSKINFSK